MKIQKLWFRNKIIIGYLIALGSLGYGAESTTTAAKSDQKTSVVIFPTLEKDAKGPYIEFEHTCFSREPWAASPDYEWNSIEFGLRFTIKDKELQKPRPYTLYSCPRSNEQP